MSAMTETCSICQEPATGAAYCEEHYEGRCEKHEDVERDDQLRMTWDELVATAAPPAPADATKVKP